MLVDSHCHLTSLNFHSLHHNLEDVINKAKVRGVEKFLSLSVTLDDFENMAGFIGNHPDIYLACGIHPSDIIATERFNYQKMLLLSKNPKVIAIGEIGLDYHYNPAETWDLQKEYFAQQIALANELNKPVAVHTRSASKDTIDVLKAENADKCRGIIHCFTENLEFAYKALDLGFYISISGIVTFKNADALRSVVKNIPLDRLLLETDSPYLAPMPYRGKENQPAYVKETCQFIAGLKNIEPEELANITTNNFKNLFQLIF